MHILLLSHIIVQPPKMLQKNTLFTPKESVFFQHFFLIHSEVKLIFYKDFWEVGQ